MIIIGIVIGAVIAININSELQDQNLVSPIMLFIAMGLSIAPLFVGIAVGFAIIATCKKYARMDRLEESTRAQNIFKPQYKNFNKDRISCFLASFFVSSIVFTVTGNFNYLVTLIITMTLIIATCAQYINNRKTTVQDRNRIILAVVLTFIAAALTISQINNLNIFMLFYGFITVPSYIYPHLTHSRSNENSTLRGVSFSLSTQSAVANGIILSQALIVGSQKDAIGTLINEYIQDDLRIILAVIVFIIFATYRTTKEYAKYYNNAPTSVSNNNNKINNKFGFVNIVLGAVIAVTQYNPFVFIITTALGIICCVLIKNNDILRSVCVPNLLLAGLILG